MLTVGDGGSVLMINECNEGGCRVLSSRGGPSSPCVCGGRAVTRQKYSLLFYPEAYEVEYSHVKRYFSFHYTMTLNNLQH